ncbi:hypothetical protein EUTSA_v10021918mg [Eutrema salsugineum]|uniref:F-box associated beta-propeller type 1 domain-containing protein n=1 Tax=Eutrema salsugineum TaxID=72664 RepID=V4NM12_EUTSA|nr:hypothetical protein EUTSA_v10021918mg [Eutrema salsugineum]
MWDFGLISNNHNDDIQSSSGFVRGNRVPATDLKRLRPTCKRWNALFKDRGFTKKHHRKAPKQSLLLIVEINLSDPSIEFKGALALMDFYHSDSRQVDIVRVFHCDGLLLCTTKHNRLVVWNPCSGETKWIHAKTRFENHSKFALGYQDNKSCRNYKLLTCRDHYDTNREFEIYEFISDSWRVLDGVPRDNFIHICGGVSLKGNTYWVASDRKDYKSKFLLCFDFTTERFTRLSLPPTQTMTGTSLSLVREEQLSLLQQSYLQLKMELWVTNNKFDTEEPLLWRRCFTVDFQHFPLFMTFLLDEEKKVAACCRQSCWYRRNMVYIIGEDDECYTEIPLGRSTNKAWMPFIFDYVPSLVQIQQCKRKE